MPDLNERMRGIDRLAAPDLLPRARTLAQGQRRNESREPGARLKRLGTIVLALMVGLVGVGVLVVAFDKARTEQPTPLAAGGVTASSLWPEQTDAEVAATQAKL